MSAAPHDGHASPSTTLRIVADLRLEVAAVQHVREVVVGLVGAGDAVAHARRVAIDHDLAREADRAREADLGAGRFLDVRRARQVHLVDAERARELDLVHLVIAAHDGHARASLPAT